MPSKKKYGFSKHEQRILVGMLQQGATAIEIATALGCDLIKVQRSLTSRANRPAPKLSPLEPEVRSLESPTPEQRELALRNPGVRWMAGELAKWGDTGVVDRYIAVITKPLKSTARARK